MLLQIPLFPILKTYLKQNINHYFEYDMRNDLRMSLENFDDNVNIDYVLLFGTALGAHREKDFIIHDTDIDVGMFDEDFDKFATNPKVKNFYLLKQYPGKSKNPTEFTFIDLINNVSFDVFKIEKINKKQGFTYSYTSKCDNMTDKRCKYLNPYNIQKIKFKGREYNIPDINFLISHYGENWKTPKKYTYSQGVNKRLNPSMIST